MSPDDWHEMVLRWNWDQGVTELDWMTSQPECDCATAALALFRGEPTTIVTKLQTQHLDPKWDYDGFVIAVARRLEQGFFTELNSISGCRCAKERYTNGIWMHFAASDVARGYYRQTSSRILDAVTAPNTATTMAASTSTTNTG